MRIAMIGAGYVGLVSGACMAEFGHDVVCVDKDAERIAALTRGEIPIYEPGLDDLVRSNVKQARLAFTSAIEDSVRTADAVFIAVGTPSRRGDEVERIIREARPDADVVVVSNPEFLREGAAIYDFKHPDRIVVGTQDERAKDLVAEIYRPLNLNRPPILYTTRRTAELIKYAANAFLATKVTFINEIADLCEKVDADVQDVARGIGLDNRVGTKFLHAGPGFGGSCFPKDIRALVKVAQDHDMSLRIMEAVLAVNDGRKRMMARKVSAIFSGALRGKTVAVLGLTFKPNTDDMREAPSIDLITALQDMGSRVRAFDPAGMYQAQAVLKNVIYCADAYDCAESADALVIVTEWEQFRALDLDRLRDLMACPVVVDLRNIYDPEEMNQRGFVYACVGRALAVRSFLEEAPLKRLTSLTKVG
jgi:UDPglucose 6-dehydrogenase